jgi:hypothetical protein
MTACPKFDVFGRVMVANRTEDAWSLLVLGPDGKRAPADVVVPAFVSEDQLLQYLDDLYHELATRERPCVKRLE